MTVQQKESYSKQWILFSVYYKWGFNPF